jgi:hypothetical protein
MDKIVTSQGNNAVPARDSSTSARMYLNSPRPALWYTVKEAMVRGQGALEGLRDRVTSPTISQLSARRIPTAGLRIEGGIDLEQSPPERGSKHDDFFE